MRIRPIDWIIHGFALMHAATTILCTLSGMPDSMLLTLLTMGMAVLICYRENLTVEITVTSLILVNTLGFILGNIGAQIPLDWMPDIWQHAVTTFSVTEVLGWALYFFAHRFSPSGAAGYEREQSWYRNAAWLVISIALVFGVRLYIEANYTGNLLIENSGALIILVVTTLLCLIFMVNFALQMQREVSTQRSRRHQAEFSYMTLKNQINPHFLFNSLNVLDSIIQGGGSREEASEYVRKMASLYRYVLKQEGKRLVPLKEEIEFARTYQDLIRIRFPEGLAFPALFSEEELYGYMVPGTLQLLIENAIKHNAISADNPLVVSAWIEDGAMVVKNNRIPKLSPVSSTGIGLQYIRNQYRDIAGKEILVQESADSFSVTIPIIRESEDFFVPLHRKSKRI